MKSVLMCALLIATGHLALLAQRGHHGMPDGVLKDSLGLSEEQVSKLEAIRIETKGQLDALRESETMDRDEMRKAMQEIRSASREKREALLTDAQMEKLAQMRTNRPARKDWRRTRPGDDRRPRKADQRKRMREKRADVRAYRQEHVHPVMLEQRAKLDQSITDADKVKIERIRAAAKAQRQELKTQSEGMKARGERPDREAIRSLREKHRDTPEMQDARSLAVKYQQEINALMEEVREDRARWKSDIREIMQPDGGQKARKGKRTGHLKRGRYSGRGHGEMSGGQRPEKRREMRELHRHIRFLLMDPDQADDNNTNQPEQSLVRNLEVYPNPASSAANLSFEVRQQTKVAIELRDESGNLVREFQVQLHEQGLVSDRLDLEGVPTGVYTIVVTPDKGGQQMIRLVINQ